MANELKTKNFSFDCDYCVALDDTNRHQLFIRLPAKDKMEAIKAFDNPAELAGLSFCSEPVPGYTRLASFRNEGEQVFFVLEV